MKEKILKQIIAFQGSFLKILRDEVELPNKNKSTREYIDHIGASAIIAKNNKNQYLLLKQYRHALQKDFFEFPAGRRDQPTEDFLLTAQRELKEETGLTAKHWNSIGEIHPCIGYANEVIKIYFAEDLTQGKSHLEEGEHIELHWCTENEISDLIKQNQITDSKTLSAWMIFSKKFLHPTTSEEI